MWIIYLLDVVPKDRGVVAGDRTHGLVRTSRRLPAAPAPPSGLERQQSRHPANPCPQKPILLCPCHHRSKSSTRRHPGDCARTKFATIAAAGPGIGRTCCWCVLLAGACHGSADLRRCLAGAASRLHRPLPRLCCRGWPGRRRGPSRVTSSCWSPAGATRRIGPGRVTRGSADERRPW